MIFYSIGRFVLEFYRGDLIRGQVGVLSTSQFISIFILVAEWALWDTSPAKRKNQIKVNKKKKAVFCCYAGSRFFWKRRKCHGSDKKRQSIL